MVIQKLQFSFPTNICRLVDWTASDVVVVEVGCLLSSADVKMRFTETCACYRMSL